jgi:hypothetical protein
MLKQPRAPSISDLPEATYSGFLHKPSVDEACTRISSFTFPYQHSSIPCTAFLSFGELISHAVPDKIVDFRHVGGTVGS